jgi:hypothetical protein
MSLYDYAYLLLCGVTISVLASNAIDRGLEPRSGQAKEQRLVGLESEQYVRVGRHVSPRTIVSVN